MDTLDPLDCIEDIDPRDSLDTAVLGEKDKKIPKSKDPAYYRGQILDSRYRIKKLLNDPLLCDSSTLLYAYLVEDIIEDFSKDPKKDAIRLRGIEVPKEFVVKCFLPTAIGPAQSIGAYNRHLFELETIKRLEH